MKKIEIQEEEMLKVHAKGGSVAVIQIIEIKYKIYIT